MRLSKITKKTIDFYPAIKDLFNSGNNERICIGFLDDSDRAVGAAVFDMESGDAVIRYFGIADKYRKKGYGRLFLEEVSKVFDGNFVSRIMYCGFNAGDEKSDFVSFLQHCGFETERGDTCRSLYDINEVIAAYPFGHGELPKGRKLIRGAAAKGKIRDKIMSLEYEMSSSMYLDTEFMLSSQNRYGGIMIEGDEIKGMLAVERFQDGARLEGIYISKGAVEEMLYLFDYAVEAIKKEDNALKTLYIDTSGEKLMKFEESLMKQKNIKCKERLTDIIAWREI